MDYNTQKKFVANLLDTVYKLRDRYGLDETKWPPILQERGDHHNTFNELLDKSDKLRNYTGIKTQSDLEKAASMSFSNNAKR